VFVAQDIRSCDLRQRKKSSQELGFLFPAYKRKKKAFHMVLYVVFRFLVSCHSTKHCPLLIKREMYMVRLDKNGCRKSGEGRRLVCFLDHEKHPKAVSQQTSRISDCAFFTSVTLQDLEHRLPHPRIQRRSGTQPRSFLSSNYSIPETKKRTEKELLGCLDFPESHLFPNAEIAIPIFFFLAFGDK